MFKISVITLSLLLFIIDVTCNSLHTKNINEQIVSASPKKIEYLVEYSNGIPLDTFINSIITLDNKGIPIEEEKYYKGKLISHIKYENVKSLTLPSNYKDCALYVLSSKKYVTSKNYVSSLQYSYLNGLLVEKKSFNTHGDVAYDVSYGISPETNKDSISKEFVYQYQENKISFESCTINKELEYKANYKYSNSTLTEKFFTFQRCCDWREPIPTDKIKYAYDSLGNLNYEYAIIDRSIKRPYKIQLDDYFDQVKIIAYKYDKENHYCPGNPELKSSAAPV